MKKAFFLVFLLGIASITSASTFSLNAINIDAERSQVDLWFPGVSENISSDSIRLRHTKSANDLIELNPSINLVSYSKGMTLVPEVRGFPNYSTMVMLNGTPINTSWGNFNSLTFLPLHSFEGVSLTKSSEAIVYGPNTLGGALNLKMPDAIDLEGFRTRFEYGESGNIRKEATYGYVSEDENNMHLFGLFTDEGHRYQKHSDFDATSFMYRGQIQLNDEYKLKLSWWNMNSSYELPDRGDPAGPFQSWDSWNTSYADIILQRDLKGGQQFTFRFYRNDDFSDMTDYSDNTYTKVLADSEMSQYRYGSEILYNLDLNNKNRLSMGLTQQVSDCTTPAFINGRQDETINGGFISNRYEANDKFAMQMSYRSDNHSEAGTENSWSVATEYQPDSNHTFVLSGGEANRFPTVRELYMQHRVFKDPTTGKWVYSIPLSGNTNIKPERSKNIEMHWKWDFCENYDVSIGYFRSIITDYMNRTRTGLAAPNPLMIWQNLDNVDLNGWESRLNGKINENLNFWVAYTRITDADDTSNGQRVDLKRNYKLTSAFNWAKNKDSIGLFVERLGPSPYYAMPPKGVPGKGRNAELEATTKIDLSYKRKLSDRSNLFINLNNLTDEDIEIDSHAIGLPAVYAPPRNVAVGLETVW
jgi:outer membrane receptor for ferrienterochelin and colicin